MLSSDIITYLTTQSQDGSCGGRRTNVQVQNEGVAQVIPHVSRNDRQNGKVLYRKLATVAEDTVNNGVLMAVMDMIDRPTLGGDSICAFPGTATDTLDDIPGAVSGGVVVGNDSQPKYGAAYITSNIAVDDQTIICEVELLKFASGTEAFFIVGRKIRLTNMPTPDAVTGTEEFLTIDTVSNVDEVVTITTVETIANAYTAGDGESRVIVQMDFGDIEASSANHTVTHIGSGDYAFDSGSYPVIPYNKGAIKDHCTLTWSDANNFSVVGTSGRSYGSGTYGVDFEPTNPDTSTSYYKLEAAGHSGTPENGDTLEFDIEPAEYDVWYKQEVPVDCPSLAGNLLRKFAIGESDQ